MSTSSADGDYMREYVRETCDQALGQLANGQASDCMHCRSEAIGHP